MTLALIIHSWCIINQKWGFSRHSYKGTFHQIQVSILLARPESGWWDSECAARLSNTASNTLVLKNTPCAADSQNTGTDGALCPLPLFYQYISQVSWQASCGSNKQMLISTSNKLFATRKSKVTNRLWAIFNSLMLLGVKTYRWRP